MTSATEGPYESDNTTGVNHGGQQANTPLERLTVSSIVGEPVENPHGEKLGTVDNVMINLNTCNVEYAMVELGAFLGIGGRLFAVPFRELTIDPDKRVFILDRDPNFLKNIPGFDKAHWPGLETTYFEEVNQYWRI